MMQMTKAMMALKALIINQAMKINKLQINLQVMILKRATIN